MLKNKTIVIGVCGGIAAYKIAEVVSRLRKLNADVHVIMTENATKFVTPLTFRTLSRNLVVTDMFAEPDPANWEIKHVSLAQKADIIVIAPATANIIGKVASGVADDMLTTTVMATKAPVVFVPAMNHNMYENSILQQNIAKLSGLGYIFMEPDVGTMAEGSVGKGRLPEPEAIVNKIIEVLLKKRDMEGLKVLVTAGPTREPLDPVRYVSNRSSGKMGYAIAAQAARRGAKVKLVSGPVCMQQPYGVEVVGVNTACEMYEQVMGTYKDCDVIILFAAVADYRCREISKGKIKKENDEMVVHLIANPDIARELGKIKGRRVLVGACAETENLINNAKAKLAAKNFDLIMANDVTMEGAGFETDTNIVKIIDKCGNIIELPLMSKLEVADRVLDEVVKLIRITYRTED